MDYCHVMLLQQQRFWDAHKGPENKDLVPFQTYVGALHTHQEIPIDFGCRRGGLQDLRGIEGHPFDEGAILRVRRLKEIGPSGEPSSRQADYIAELASLAFEEDPPFD